MCRRPPYVGATQWLAAGEQPPALKAIAPVITGSNYFHGWVYQGGAFQLGFNLFWVNLMSRRRRRDSSFDMQALHLPIKEPPLTRPPPLRPAGPPPADQGAAADRRGRGGALLQALAGALDQRRVLALDL